MDLYFDCFFVESGAVLNFTDNLGDTALAMAQVHCHQRVIEVLEAAGDSRSYIYLSCHGLNLQHYVKYFPCKYLLSTKYTQIYIDRPVFFFRCRNLSRDSRCKVFGLQHLLV